MDTARLQAEARSILTASPSLELVGPSYGFVNSEEIVKRFERQNWKLYSARQVNVRDKLRDGYQRHLLRFRSDSFKRIDGLTNNHESIPELIVENSHDGSSALKIFFGVFRIACLNGIIAGSSVASMRVIHSQSSIKRLDESIDNMTGGLPGLVKRVERFSQVQLSDDQKMILARDAAEIRLGETKNVSWVDHVKMLRPKRMQDTGSDAFSIFNILQEKVIRGGIVYAQANNLGLHVKKQSRGIRSVAQSVALNRSLWDFLERVAS